MLKKLKKLYFKIYHLFKLIGIFIIVFGLSKEVYAEGQEYNECFDEYLIGTTTLVRWSNNEQRITPKITDKIEANKTYYIRFFPETNYNCSTANNICFSQIIVWNSNSQQIQGINWTDQMSKENFDKEKQILTFTTKENVDIKSVAPIVYSYQSNYNVLNGVKFIISDNIDDVLTCRTPTPQPNEAYTNFITLYTNRLNYLAEGFTSNPYLIAMIGIIIAWVVLELTLKLFNLKGGYKK